MTLLGPVFDVELVTTVRRARYYWLRAGYVAILLALIGSRYWQVEAEAARARQAPSPTRMNEFGRDFFAVLAAVQPVALLLLIPALVGGTIADERQRKTLHYLLASELTGPEIVLGKLAARLLHAAVILAAGAPVVALLTLFGGIDPKMVAISFGGAASTAFFAASLAIFASAVSARVREAVGLAYLMEVGWLVGPWFAESVFSGWAGAEAVVRPVASWWEATQPFALIHLGMTPDDALMGRIGRMIGLQVAVGLGFAALAIWRLRPNDRAGAASIRPARRRMFGRPIGDDPMLWKECRTARSRGPLRVVWLGAGLMLLASLGFQVATTAIPAFEELAAHGYGVGTGPDLARRSELHTLISTATGVVSFAWLVAVASTAACGLTSEREDDTWISLVGTPMDGPEILRAKRFGAFLRPRAMGLTLATLWAVGVAAGAVHPLSIAVLLAEIVAVGGFAASLGTYLSLRSRTTGRALVATLGLVFALMVGAPVVGSSVDDEGLRGFFFALNAPALFLNSCADYVRIRQSLGRGEGGGPRWESSFVRQAATVAATTALYAAAAFLLARRADLRFDRAVDRPRRAARAAAP